MLDERVYAVLMVSAKEKFNQAVSPLLPERDFTLTVTGSVASARRFLLEKPVDLLLVNTPLPDDVGLRLAMDVCNTTDLGVLLFVKNDLYDEISQKAQMAGVFTLPRPVSREAVALSLRLLCATRERLRRAQRKSASIQDKMEEIRLVNRAKLLLMEHAKMTESDAHHFLEKQAMNRRISRRELAQSIIRTYQ